MAWFVMAEPVHHDRASSLSRRRDVTQRPCRRGFAGYEELH